MITYPLSSLPQKTLRLRAFTAAILNMGSVKGYKTEFIGIPVLFHIRRDFNDQGREKNRPKFPKRAVITGNALRQQELHLVTSAGFVHADAFARFLRDRIGEENVIFISGTDCYGSPISESYRRLVEEEGTEKTIENLWNITISCRRKHWTGTLSA